MCLNAYTSLCPKKAQALQLHSFRNKISVRTLHCASAVDRHEPIPLRKLAPRTTTREQPQDLQKKDKIRRHESSFRDMGAKQGGRLGSAPAPFNANMAKLNTRLVTAPLDDQLPRLDALIIVEGFNDCSAIQRAVRSPVFVLGGGYALAEEMKPKIRHLAGLAASGELPRQVVVFTDPDWQGRMFRTYLDDLLTQPTPSSGHRLTTTTAAPGYNSKPGMSLMVRHAFLRVEEGTSEVANRYHEAGNVGVEHASPETIRASLVRARPSFGPGRSEFSVEQLRADGLIGSWDDKKQVAGPQLQRVRFCRALGIDEVGTGKGLVNLLNRFFTREEYEAALKVARGRDSQQ